MSTTGRGLWDRALDAITTPETAADIRARLAENPKPSLEQLIQLEATTAIESQLDAVRQSDAHYREEYREQGREDEWPQSLRGQRIGAKIAFLERQLEAAQYRDELAAERPEGCLCLGLGGLDPIAIRHDTADAEETPIMQEGRQVGAYQADRLVPVTDDDGAQVFGFRTYCRCPDGERARRETQVAYAGWLTRWKAERLAKRWGGLGLDQSYRSLTLDGLLSLHSGHRQLVANLRRWLETDAWLVLTGEVGVGKTGIVACLVKALLRQGASCLVRTVPDLLVDLRATWGGKGDESVLLADLAAVDVLALDDIGVNAARDWADERLFQIINKRYGNNKRCILTSNLFEAELVEYLGDRVWDRVIQRANGHVYNVVGPNLRRVSV